MTMRKLAVSLTKAIFAQNFYLPLQQSFAAIQYDKGTMVVNY